MKKISFGLVVGIVCAVGAVYTVQAAPPLPSSTSSFGALPPSATFGGTGIPTNHTEITTVTGLPNNDVLTLGLSATPYKAAGDLGYDASTATFYAPAGVSPFNSGRSTWNFDFFISMNNGADLSDLIYNLTMTDGTTSDSISPAAVAIADGGKSVTANSYQDSENIVFYGYSPLADGTYTFDLTASEVTGLPVASDQITVVVGAWAPDTTSTLALAAASVAGLLIASRRKSVGAAL